MKEVLGLALDGVICFRELNGVKRSEAENIEIVDAIEMLKRFTEGRFKDNVHILLRAGRLPALEELHFHDRVQIPEENLHFYEDDAEIKTAYRNMRATHVIHHHLKPLAEMNADKLKGGKDRALYLFNPNEKDVGRFLKYVDRITIVTTWKELATLLLQ